MVAYNLERLNFLVVDDNRHMRSLVRTILRALGARNVAEATDGADAYQRLGTYAPDVIICNWQMSPMDGLEFVRLVRTDTESPNPFVPVIMLTAHTEAKRVVEARDAGVTEFLAKPISAHQLYSRIVAVIERPRPFIRAKPYVGPERRRRQDPKRKGRNDGSESRPRRR
ncbi:MAG: response regulator [Alphaproteobacteria bacterium]